MLRLPIIVGFLILAITVSGCFTLKAYVDPGLRSVSYTDFKSTDKGPVLGVLVEFQRDGETFPTVTGDAREIVLRVLNQSKLFSNVLSGTVGSEVQLKVVINNTGGETRGSGTATGLTLGAVGTATTDNYIITTTYEDSGVEPITQEYRHAIHATLGNKKGPAGLESMTIDEAFDKVVEQVILLLLYDLQQKGVL